MEKDRITLNKKTATPLESIAQLNNLGMNFIESGDFPAAGRSLAQALEEANSIMFLSDVHVRSGAQATLTKCNGDNQKKTSYLYQRDDYDEGMSTFAQPMAIFPEHSSFPTCMATVLFNFGQLCLRLGDEHEAYVSFLRALVILSDSSSTSPVGKAFVDNAPFMIAILHNVGHIQYRNATYDDASETYSRALAIGRQVCSRSTQLMLAVSSTLNCLGVVQFHLPKVDTQRVLVFYHEALFIRRSVLGQDAETTEISTILNNIGRVHYMKLEYEAALKMYSESLAMRRRLLGEDHLDVAATSKSKKQ